MWKMDETTGHFSMKHLAESRSGGGGFPTQPSGGDATQRAGEIRPIQFPGEQVFGESNILNHS